MGIGTIMKARAILVVASGVDKAQIVRDAFFGPVTPQFPRPFCSCTPTLPSWLTPRPDRCCKACCCYNR